MSVQSGVGTGKEAEVILADVVRRLTTIEEIMPTMSRRPWIPTRDTLGPWGNVLQLGPVC
jgi:hypothetical protein